MAKTFDDWDEVADHNSGGKKSSLHKKEVEGGFLYRNIHDKDGVSIAFVPHPVAKKTGSYESNSGTVPAKNI